MFCFVKDGSFCTECPRGAVCSTEGTLIQTVEAERGWWPEVSGKNTMFYECQAAGVCLGGSHGSPELCHPVSLVFRHNVL